MFISCLKRSDVPLEVPQEGCIKGRFATVLRMAPSLIALSACIVGVVFFILGNYLIPAILSGVGAIGALYMLNQAYDFNHLYSLAVSAKQFKEQNVMLTTQVQNFTTQNGELRTNIQTMENALELDRKEKATLNSYLEKVKESVTGDITSLTQFIDSLPGVLKDVCTSILKWIDVNQMQAQVETIQQLDTQIEKQEKQVKSLQETTKHLEDTIVVLKKQISDEVGEFREQNAIHRELIASNRKKEDGVE